MAKLRTLRSNAPGSNPGMCNFVASVTGLYTRKKVRLDQVGMKHVFQRGGTNVGRSDASLSLGQGGGPPSLARVDS